MSFGANGTQYADRKREAQIKIGRRDKPLSEWFRRGTVPRIPLHAGYIIEQDYLLQMKRDVPPTLTQLNCGMGWAGTDIKRRSHRRHTGTRQAVQYKVIQESPGIVDQWT